jgi:ankyrin repeat protein
MTVRRLKLSGAVLAAILTVGCAPSPEEATMAAIEAGDVAALRAALARKPDLEPRCGPYEICKPLARASSQANLDMIRMLIEAGADPNGVNAYGDTALMVAGDSHSAKGGPGADAAVIRAYLLAHGADPNQFNQSSASAFMGAAALGELAALELCLTHGGKINLQAPKSGFTPLMGAAQFGQAESVRWLLAHGADPSLKDSDGRDARKVAQDNGHHDVAALLP